ncbi:MAG: response regulator transcription factor [Paludibacter sp.]
MANTVFIIVDNNDIYRLGLKCIIHEQFQSPVIHYAINNVELQLLLLENSNAVVIVDLDRFGMDDINKMYKSSTRFPKTHWLIVSSVAEEPFLMHLTSTFSNSNFVLKSNDCTVVAIAIIDTANAKKYYCSEALQIIMEVYNRKEESVPKIIALTPTELELVHLLTQGKSAKEIAEIRSISLHTINTHRKNIFRKLAVNNLQELIKYALKNGLVDLTEYYI